MPPLAAGSGWANPLAVDTSAFPRIRVYLPAGEPAPGAVTEDGKPVAADALTGAAARPPLLLALVLDTSGSIAEALPQIQSAAAALVGRMRDTDRMALVRFSDRVEVLLGPTTDRGALLRRIATLKADGATALYDAVWMGVRQARDAAGAGLRAEVLLTDGKDEGEGPAGTPGSALRFEPLRQQLMTAGVPLYALGLGKDVDRDVLTALAAASGGRVFFANQPGEVQGLLDTVAGTLLETRGFAYLSPHPAPDGSRRTISGFMGPGGSTSPGGVPGGGVAPAWSIAYVAPRQQEVLWRWPVAAPESAPGLRRRAACGVGALSSAGSYAFASGPPTLLRGDGTPDGTVAQLPSFRPERARVLEDSSAFLIGGADSAFYSRHEDGFRRVMDGPANWIAIAPGGTYALRLVPQTAGPPLLEAVEAVTDTRLWSVRCPGTACDRLAGAALGDDGVALINQTGALYRIAENGKLSPARPEVFYGPVSLSADGKLAAAVVWQDGPGGGDLRSAGPGNSPRALLMDQALRTVDTLAVRAADADLPPVAALSPRGAYLAVLDDARLMGVALAEATGGQRRMWRLLGRPASTPSPCERTLQIDDMGRVLTSDGDSVSLLRGFAQP